MRYANCRSYNLVAKGINLQLGLEILIKKLKYHVGDGDKLVEGYCPLCFERWLEYGKTVDARKLLIN
jgi:hypothetical protein